MTKEELFKAALDRLFDEVFGPYTGATRWITAQENMNKKEELRQNNSLREKAIVAIVDEQRKTNQLLSNLLELLSKQKPGDPLNLQGAVMNTIQQQQQATEHR